jgi:hypothetical protein
MLEGHDPAGYHRIALANPESVFVGMLGAEIMDKAFNDQKRSTFIKTSLLTPRILANLPRFLC